MDSKFELPSTKTIISTAASVAATAVLIRSIAKDIIPHELSQYFFDKVHRFFSKFSNEVVLVINEFEGITRNELFYAVEMYLSTIDSPSTKIFKASIPEKEKNIHVSVGGNEDLNDRFNGIDVKWRIVHQQTNSHFSHYDEEEQRVTVKVEYKFMELIFHKKNKKRVIDEYLPYILAKSKEAKQEKKTLKLHTLKSDGVRDYPPQTPWQEVNLDHPATFEALAMEDETKKMIINDLDMFLKRREFYKRIGKAWKRGYLLFGPPGTGKSTLIAAMANYLKFDIYDLELTALRSNSELRNILLWTANRSILVVEDIDASIDLSKRSSRKPMRNRYPFNHKEQEKITLSGLLNFTDGLWSSCGDERIIVFTTNHVDKIDSALLRPGRMDLHIHMSYCTPSCFKMLLSNYHGSVDHTLVSEAEKLIAEKSITPAEVSEQLLKSDNVGVVLEGLVDFLEKKKEGKSELQENEVAEGEGFDEENQFDNQVVDELKAVLKMTQSSTEELKNQICSNNENLDTMKSLIQVLGGVNGIKVIKD